MKKIICIALLFVLCAGLCACQSIGAAFGGGEETVVTMPTVPEQVTVPALPNAGEVESTEATGETQPWDVEFHPEEYNQYEGQMVDVDGTVTGTCITWSKISMFEPDRYLVMHNNGDMEDLYYGYADSDFPSHEYFYGADGSYREYHYLNNGYYDAQEDMSYWGTTIYYKIIEPDGSYTEMQCDENGYVLHEVHAQADGFYEERVYFENGNLKMYTCQDPATKEYRFEEYFESGGVKKTVFDQPEEGRYFEQEYYENGFLRYNKDQSAEYTMEERYDEEGYHTYFYSKNAAFEIELIADETGKLVTVIENGTEITDPAYFAQYISGCNFRQ